MLPAAMRLTARRKISGSSVRNGLRFALLLTMHNRALALARIGPGCLLPPPRMRVVIIRIEVLRNLVYTVIEVPSRLLAWHLPPTNRRIAPRRGWR